MSDNRPHEVNLLDLIAFVLRWRVFLITAVLSVSVVVGVISFLLAPKYRSTAVVQGAETQSQGIGSLVASKLSTMGALAGFSPMMGEVPGELFVQLLKSRWMTERFIERFDLRRVYHMEGDPIEDVIKAALANTRYELDPQSQSVLIYAEDRDPKRCYEMAQFLVEELDRRNSDLKSEQVRREREFIEKRLAESQERLAALEDSMAQFQTRSGILNPEEQVKATIQAAAALEAEKLAVRTQLELNRLIHGGRESDADAYLRSQVTSIDSTLQSLIRPKAVGEPVDFLPRLQDTPDQAMQFLRLKRDIEIQQMLVAFLVEQHERARIEERRNTPTLLRLDPPALATKRVWPRRGLMVTVAAFGALVLAVLIALTLEFIRAVGDPAHPQHERAEQIRRSGKSHRKFV